MAGRGAQKEQTHIKPITVNHKKLACSVFINQLLDCWWWSDWKRQGFTPLHPNPEDIQRRQDHLKVHDKMAAMSPGGCLTLDCQKSLFNYLVPSWLDCVALLTSPASTMRMNKRWMLPLITWYCWCPTRRLMRMRQRTNLRINGYENEGWPILILESQLCYL